MSKYLLKPSTLLKTLTLNNVALQKGILPLWKKLFLSEASAAILHDAFWWIFLEMFEVCSCFIFGKK